jgi:signal transduction histidine kinase
MKIRNRLYLGTAVTIVLVVILLSAVFITSDKIARENKKHELVMSVEHDIFALNILTHEYALYHEERTQEQWYLIYNSMGWVLEEESTEPLRDDYIALGDLFKQLTENYESEKELIQEGASQEEIDVALELEERLTTRLLMKSQSIATESFRIASEASAAVDEAQKTTNTLIIVLMAILAIVVSSASFTVAESINRPIKKLMDGTKIIGKGNLDHRIGIASDDEIGELAVAFDDMTEKRKDAEDALQKAHDELEMKVEERTEELTAANEELTASQEELHNSNEELTSINEEYEATNEELTATQNELQTLNQELEARVKERTKKLRAEITERKKAEKALEVAHEKLQTTYDELKSIDTLKTDIISNVSHELRTPITIMRGALELIPEEDDPKERNTLIDTAINALARQNMIVGDLIEATDIAEETRKKLNLKPMDLKPALNQIIEEFELLLEKEEVKVKIQMQKGLPKVKASPDKLGHILRNLISNAIKFNGIGGSITIKAAEKKGFVETCVSDTGVGIPEDRLGKIFGRLYQGDASSTREHGGTGLGLAIVKELVEAHRGKITVKSTPKKGSTFCFTLPAYREE